MADLLHAVLTIPVETVQCTALSFDHVNQAQPAAVVFRPPAHLKAAEKATKQNRIPFDINRESALVLKWMNTGLRVSEQNITVHNCAASKFFLNYR